MTPSPKVLDGASTHTSALVLFWSLAVSPWIVTAVAWFVTGGGADPFGASDLAGWIVWVLLNVAGFVLWELFRRKAIEPATAWAERGRRVEGFTAWRLQSHLVVAWAGAELAGLAGAIVFLLIGKFSLLAGSLLLSAICFARSVPRAEWFSGLDEAESHGDE